MPSSIASFLKHGAGPLLKAPSADGASGEALITDGAGNLTFAAPEPALHNHDAEYDPLGAAAAVDAALGSHVNDPTAAHAASAIAVTPAGNIASTDVQAALAELDAEKSATGHHHDAAYAPVSRTLTAGDGLSGGGNLSADRTFSVNVDGATIEINADILRVKDNGVSYAKLQQVSATARLLARKTAGAGNVEECTLSEILDFIGSAAQGDLLYRGATGWARLAAGTNGHFLQTQGAGQNPQWAAGGGGGGSSEIDINTQTTGYTLQATDLGDLIDFTTAGVTLTLLAAATAGDKFYCYVRHSGAEDAILTIDGNSSETIDGALTVTLFPNEVRLLICDGSNWQSVVVRESSARLTNPLDASFSWVNQGSTTLVNGPGGIVMGHDGGTGGWNIAARVMSAPSTPYTVTICLEQFQSPHGNSMVGLALRDSASGKLVTLTVQTDTGPGGYQGLVKWDDPTSVNSTYFNNPAPGLTGRLRIWFRVYDNGTNRTFYLSHNGVQWMEVATHSRTDFMTANQIGWFGSVTLSTGAFRATLCSWKVT